MVLKTVHDNETLFLKVQDFLTKCGRFNPRQIYQVLKYVLAKKAVRLLCLHVAGTTGAYI